MAFTGFHKASNFADHVAVIQGDHTVLARVKGGVRHDKETAAANARLMAASPEMFRLLTWCVDTLRARSPEVLGAHPEGAQATALLATIAKAEGR